MCVPALLAGAYTTTFLVMVDRVKGERHPHPTGWADFTLMMECTPESGLCHSVCTLCKGRPRGGGGGDCLMKYKKADSTDLRPIFGAFEKCEI